LTNPASRPEAAPVGLSFVPIDAEMNPAFDSQLLKTM
jgi:hypothetical protein